MHFLLSMRRYFTVKNHELLDNMAGFLYSFNEVIFCRITAKVFHPVFVKTKEEFA